MIKKGLLVFITSCCAVVMAESKQEAKYYSLATGYYNGLYYYTGTQLSALLNNAGGLPCGEGGSCGVNGLVLKNYSSTGSMDNLAQLCAGEVDFALVQSNLVYMAYKGIGPFETKACPQIRAIASLYPELLQIAVHKDSNIHYLTDLKNKKVAVGAMNSGTFDGMKEILNAAGINSTEIQFSHGSLKASAEAFSHHQVDAFAFFAGIPTPVFQILDKKAELKFLSITGNGVESLLAKSPYYRQAVIDQKIYSEISTTTPTVSVNALLVTTEKADKAFIYQFTSRLWDINNQPYWFTKRLLIDSFQLENSLDGIGIPLHDGAKKYYNEIGKRF
ncbi:TAXI family TRAP transporter solute-binding subunit [Suttonella ornithocola]|uniref:ABC-type taurine transport system, periplasmic component n=1 Tax=Suttonella ornithocola TaxID=279832 RepID=A0A380MZM0_9GAMM|nr:TAXI family TRAP transporter solute-binding subunit [Suttonella ornithocola]SUO97131.1 ABC-type taurine transport system, periplasmic component [Suttonella ornithocola]